MKRLLFLGAVLLVAFALFLGLALPARQERADSVRVADRFIGAWRLAWLEEPDADGNIHKADCSGLLAYTRDGHMSVQVMYRSPQGAAQAGPVRYAQGGYEASFGTYQINENAHTFTFHVEGAMVRGLIGKDLTRLYEFSGKQLIVKSSDPNEHWRVAWEHY
jgi:Lipocalin-like domain